MLSTGFQPDWREQGKHCCLFVVAAYRLCINTLSQMVQLVNLWRYWHWVGLIADLHTRVVDGAAGGQEWPSSSGSVPLPAPLPSLLGWLGVSVKHSSVRSPWHCPKCSSCLLITLCSWAGAGPVPSTPWSTRKGFIWGHWELTASLPRAVISSQARCHRAPCSTRSGDDGGQLLFCLGFNSCRAVVWLPWL